MHGVGKGADDWMQTIIFAITQKHKIGDLSQIIYPLADSTPNSCRTYLLIILNIRTEYGVSKNIIKSAFYNFCLPSDDYEHPR